MREKKKGKGLMSFYFNLRKGSEMEDLNIFSLMAFQVNSSFLFSFKSFLFDSLMF